MREFDPDKAFVKHRGMNGVWYEQDGHKFSSGYTHIGPVKEKPKPKAVETESAEDVRERARAKIAKKRSKKKTSAKKLDGFREKETPEAVSNAQKENEKARQAEERAG